jgi:hypothetical protein
MIGRAFMLKYFKQVISAGIEVHSIGVVGPEFGEGALYDVCKRFIVFFSYREYVDQHNQK